MLWISAASFAQQPAIRNFTSADYHGGTQNWNIAQDSSGVVFIANNNGMLVFDGDMWDTRPVSNGTSVRCVHVTNDRSRIYVGASDEFGYFFFDEEAHSMDYHSLAEGLPADHRHFGEIWNIHVLNNLMIFQSKTALFVLTPKGKIETYDFDKQIQTSTVVGNRLLLSSREGIFAFNGTSIMPFAGTENLKGMDVCAILQQGKNLLFVTDLNGVFIFDGKQCTPYIMDITPFLQANQVFCADIKKDYIAFGTVLEGAVIKNLKTGQTQYANRFNKLINNTVLSMKFDDMDNLWLGLDNGLAYVATSSPYHELTGPRDDIGTGYASTVKNDMLYLGTNQGLFFIDYPIRKGPVPQMPQRIQGLTGQVWMLETIDDILLCGADKGAFIVNGTQVQRIEGMDGTWNFVPLQQHPGNVISCDYQGVCILKREGSGFVKKNRLKGFGEVSNTILEDKDGTIWVAHWQKGVYHLWLNDDLTAVEKMEIFDQNNGLPTSNNNKLCRINGTIFVSSAAGFHRYNPKTKKLELDSSRSKIFNTFGQPLRVEQGGNGDLWGIKQDYCAVAHPQSDGTYVVDSLSFQELAPQLQINFGRIAPLDKDHMLLTGNNGFFLVESRYKMNAKHHDTFIRFIKSTLHNDSVLYGNYVVRKQQQTIKIPHDLNSIRIEFAQAEFRSANAVVYQCYLKGYDKSWSTGQTTTAKDYTGLSKGKYTFYVRAHNRITNKTDEAQIGIEILPAWYETWFAYIIYFALLVFLLGELAKYLKKRGERKFQTEKMEKERQLREQQAQFEIENAKKEKELAMLKSEQLEVELKHKSSELADSTMNLIRKNDMLQELDENMNDLSESVRREDAKAKISKKISEIRRNIKNNMAEDENWDRFEQNFNLVYDNFMQKLTAAFPDLKTNDKKLCAYLRMGLSSKEMASLLNTSVRSIETARYRLRKKLNMESGENLTDFIQHFENVEEGGQA